MTENARKFIASFQDVIQANVFTSKCEFFTTGYNPHYKKQIRKKICFQ